MPIRICIAHESVSIRLRLRDHLGSAPDLEIVGETSDGAEALKQCSALVPDVLVLDVVLPTLNGVSLLEKIRAAGLPTRALVLTEQRASQWIRWAVEAGASGYLFVDEALAQLAESVRAVHAGEVRLSASTLQKLVETGSSAGTARRSVNLTPRERQVLALLTAGKRSAEIATVLGVSIGTVDTHRANLMHKLGVRTSAELVQVAIEDRLV